MSPFRQEAVEAVKRIDLLTYFESTVPNELVRDGAAAFKTRTHGSLTISNGKWYWHSRGIGGRTALDYLIKVEGHSFPEAMKRLLSLNIPDVKRNLPDENRKSNTFVLPQRHGNNDKAKAYLASRGIREDVYGPLMEQGLIYESRFRYAGSYREAANVVFVGKDEGGVPRYAGIRGIGTGYKGEAAGSDKRYSFSITNRGYPGTGLNVFESAIDLLSYASAMSHESCGHAVGHMLSLGGLGSMGKREFSYFPLALSHYLRVHEEVTAVTLRLDNDVAGRLAAGQIANALKGSYTVADAPPKRGKDYNDYLRIKYGGEPEHIERRCRDAR